MISPNPETERSTQHLQNKSFDKDNQILAFEMLGYDGSNPVRLATDSDGKIKIDTATSPFLLLDQTTPQTISDSIRVDLGNNKIARLNNDSSASAIWGTNIGFISEDSEAKICSNGATPLVFYTGATRNSMTQGTERARLDTSGNFTVRGSSLTVNEAGNTNSYLNLKGYGIITGESGKWLKFDTPGSTLYLNNTSYGQPVQVGRTAQSTPLNVYGDIYSSEDVDADGNITATGAVTGSNLSNTNTGDQVIPDNEAGSSNNFLTAYNSATGAWTKAQPTWANIDKTTSDIADITTKSHTSLSDIGTLTHATIDGYLDQAVKQASSPTFSGALFTDKIKFTQTDGNEAIDSLADGYMDYLATTEHRFNSNVDIAGKVTASTGVNLVNGASGSKMSFYDNAVGGAYLQLDDYDGDLNVMLRSYGDSYLLGGDVGIGTSTLYNLLSIGGLETSAAITQGNLGVKADSAHKNITLQEYSGAEQWELGVNADGDLGFFNSGSATPTMTLLDSDGLDLANNKLIFGSNDDLTMQVTQHASSPALNLYPAGGSLTSSRFGFRCVEGVNNHARFQGVTGTTAGLASSNTIGIVEFLITQADPDQLKGEINFWVNTGDNVSVRATLDDTGTFNVVGGFSDNGTPGIDTTFLDQDGNTITVRGGIIVSKTAP